MNEQDEWIRASDALAMLAPTFSSHMAARRICERAHNGLISARAESYRAGASGVFNDFDIPANFWWAEGHEALEQDWAAGDFSTWIEKRIHLRAFGVSFRRADVERLLPSKRAILVGEAHTAEDTQIIEKLALLVPTSALSYDQAIRDLGDASRVSFRGPALEFREALREVLDHLAPDRDVMGEPGYKPEKDEKGGDRPSPTMTQKTRYILRKKRGASSAAEQTVTAFEEAVSKLTRAVYQRSSKAAHVAGERAAVVQIRRYVVAILHDIL